MDNNDSFNNSQQKINNPYAFVPKIKQKKQHKKKYLILGIILIFIISFVSVRAVVEKMKLNAKYSSINEVISDNIKIMRDEYTKDVDFKSIKETEKIIEGNKLYIQNQINSLKYTGQMQIMLENYQTICQDGKKISRLDNYLYKSSCNDGTLGKRINKGNYENFTVGGSSALMSVFSSSSYSTFFEEMFESGKIYKYDPFVELSRLVEEYNSGKINEDQVIKEIKGGNKKSYLVKAQTLDLLSIVSIQAKISTKLLTNLNNLLLNLSKTDSKKYRLANLTEDGKLTFNGFTKIPINEITQLDNESDFFNLLNEFVDSLKIPTVEEIKKLDLIKSCPEIFEEKDLKKIMETDIFEKVLLLQDSKEKICDALSNYKKIRAIKNINSLNSEKNVFNRLIIKTNLIAMKNCKSVYGSCLSKEVKKISNNLTEFIKSKSIKK